MELKPGYKQTEAGVIPEDWSPIQIGEIFSFKNGLNKAKKFFGKGTPIVNYMDVFEHPGLHIRDLNGRVTLSKAEIDRFDVRAGDVFFTRTSETVEEIGTAAVMLDSPNATVFSGFVLRARPIANYLEDSFKQYCFADASVRAQIVTKATYTTRALTNGRLLSSVWIALPPKSEQRIIAAALSDVDELLAGLDRLIAKKRDLKQAAMQQLLTGDTRLPGFTGSWGTRTIGEYGKCLRGVSYNPEVDLYRADSENSLRLLRANNISGNLINLAQLQYVDKRRVAEGQTMRLDDILICMASGSKQLIGKAARFSIEDGNSYTFGAFMGCLRIGQREGVPHFVAQLLQTKQFRDYIGVILSGSSINNLRPSDIEAAEFNMPQFDEQRAIASVLSNMDAENEALERRRTKTADLKQAMMQELLTGKTRLAKPGGNDA